MKESENMKNYPGFSLTHIWDFMKKIPLDVEWYKWLNYESETEKERIALINSKSASEITHEDIDFLKRQKQLPHIKETLENYLLTGKYDEEDWDTISICKENDHLLEKVMIDKLTKEELLKAKEKLLNYESESLDKLSDIVKDLEDNYASLSYVDAFAFHYLSEHYYYFVYRKGWQTSNAEYYKKALISEKIRQDSAIAARF